MAVRIDMEVPKNLVNKMKKMDDESLSAICEQEMEKRIDYLETVLAGWKTYKNVKKEHRRLLFLMLMLDNKDSLHDYERRVLYPKVLEMKKANELEAKKTQPKLGSLNSVEKLGADSLDSLNHSGSQSPLDEYKLLPSCYSRVESPEDHIDDNEPQTSNRSEKVHEMTESDAQNDNAVTQPSSMNSCDFADCENAVETMEDRTVVSAAPPLFLPQNIVLAAQQVRVALDTVEMMRSQKSDDIANAITKMQLLTIESVLMKSVAEESQKGILNNQNLSKGAKRRMKKAANKAETLRKQTEETQQEEINRQKQAVLAAEAVRIIEAKQSQPSPAPAPTKPSKEHVKLPLSKEELEIFIRITRSGQTIFIPGSKEEKVMKKYDANREVLEEYLRSRCSAEVQYNAKVLQQIRQITDEIQGVSESPKMSPEEQMLTAKTYILNKLDYWAKSKALQAPHFVEMYQYFAENCTRNIANVIAGFIPYENLPNAQFEHTMLLQFQTGKFFVDKNGEEPFTSNILC